MRGERTGHPGTAAFGRRELLAGIVGVMALARVRPVLARPSLATAVAAFAGGSEVRPGRIQFEIPPLVDNGNAVGVTVSVDSPMTEADYVKRIALFNEKNPQAEMAVFRLGPRAGEARVSTRLRLATSQTVVAVAEMSDGSFWSSEANVVVTLAACIEDLL